MKVFLSLSAVNIISKPDFLSRLNFDNRLPPCFSSFKYHILSLRIMFLFTFCHSSNGVTDPGTHDSMAGYNGAS